MKKEYFVVQGVQNSGSQGMVYLSHGVGGGYDWDGDRDQAMQFASERAAYRSVLFHWTTAPIHVLLDTVRVVRVIKETIEKLEVLET